MLNLLADPIVSVVTLNGTVHVLSLPQLFSHSMRDDIATLPRLRAHQRGAMYAFLVQLGYLACERAGIKEASSDAIAWAELLRALTPDWPDDEPWSLVVEDPAKPAFMQPPTGNAATLKNRIEQADTLDFLVTSRNHEIKQALMSASMPQDWMFSLISLQTQEGFLGAGNYGVARMNAGFGNRSFMTVAPASCGFGGRIRRDIEVLLAQEDAVYRHSFLGGDTGHSLLWLLPWDGTTALELDSLHPLFIEICRRVRLYSNQAEIYAVTGGSKVARINAKANLGNVGDPWLPLQIDKEVKAMTLASDGFSYKRMSKLLFDQNKYQLPLLARPSARESKSSIVYEVFGLVRGQGKTEGYYHRRVLCPANATICFFDSTARDVMARRSELFVRLAGAVSGKALRPALIQLYQGKQDLDWRKPSNDRLCKPWLGVFDALVDKEFFGELFASENDGEDAAELSFSKLLRAFAKKVLDQAISGAPHSEKYRDLAVARARLLLGAALKKQLAALRAPETVND